MAHSWHTGFTRNPECMSHPSRPGSRPCRDPQTPVDGADRGSRTRGPRPLGDAMGDPGGERRICW